MKSDYSQHTLIHSVLFLSMRQGIYQEGRKIFLRSFRHVFFGI